LDTDASKTLKAGGVEVVVGSLFNKESLKKAIQGFEVVFGVRIAFLFTPVPFMKEKVANF
jgi:uncharacterized protein YbjT (DUF2867 family)